MKHIHKNFETLCGVNQFFSVDTINLFVTSKK